MRIAFLLLSAVLTAAPATTALAAGGYQAQAGVGEVPGVIIAGFKSFKQDGPAEAMKVWTRNGPLEGSPEAQKHVAELQQMSSVYGTYRGFEIAGTHAISSTTHVIYLVVDYEKGPLFGKFVMYHSDLGWLLTSISFNLDADTVLPAPLPLAPAQP